MGGVWGELGLPLITGVPLGISYLFCISDDFFLGGGGGGGGLHAGSGGGVGAFLSLIYTCELYVVPLLFDYTQNQAL